MQDRIEYSILAINLHMLLLILFPDLQKIKYNNNMCIFIYLIIYKIF